MSYDPLYSPTPGDGDSGSDSAFSPSEKRTLAHETFIRIGAGVVFGFCVYTLFTAAGVLISILSFSAAVGAIIPLTASERLSAGIERQEARLLMIRQRAARGGWLMRLFGWTAAVAGGIWMAVGRIRHDHVRSGARLAAVSFVTLGAISAAFFAVMAAVALLMLVFALFIAAAVLQQQSSGGQSGNRRKAGVLGNAALDHDLFGGGSKDVHIAKDGRIVKPGFFGDTSTGYRVDRDGSVVKDGWLGSDSTGIRIGDDGRIKKDGWLGADDTGMSIDDEGRLKKSGWFGSSDTGVRFRKRD
jgi:hypothetical protein